MSEPARPGGRLRPALGMSAAPVADGRADLTWHAAMRLAVSTVVGAVALGIAIALSATWPVAVSVAWDASAITFLLWVWLPVWRMDAAATARFAQAEDFSRAVSDLVLLSACVASLVAVAFTLEEAGRHTGGEKAWLIALTVLTVALAWGSVHTAYMLRYSRLYYSPPVGGIDFGDDAPDYHDFAYLALTIGMTYQVSDTTLDAKKTRRTAIRHALLSFLFGTVIVAVTINIVAGLLNG